MKINRIVLAACALAACSALAGAQAANPVATALRNSLKSATNKMVAAAKEMPAEKYSFKPTPESMSFGQLVLHVANSNQSMCQWVSAAAPAIKTTLTPTSPKDELVAFLQKSFEYCQQSLASLSDADLSKEVPSFGGRKVSQAQLILSLSDDWADHYSQQAAYLRLNKLLPPTARPRRGR